jgi:hypothetical protein
MDCQVITTENSKRLAQNKKRRAVRAALKLNREPAVHSAFQAIYKGAIVCSEHQNQPVNQQFKLYIEGV